VDHQQIFAFCLAHWVKPHDHFMHQQTLTSLSGTCSQHTPQPDNHHLFTHAAGHQQNTGGAQKSTEMGKDWVYQVCPLNFFDLFLFLLVFLYQHNPPSPGECPIHLTMPRPAAGHKKCAICGAFLVLSSYSSFKHEKHKCVCIFCIWWVSCPLPTSSIATNVPYLSLLFLSTCQI